MQPLEEIHLSQHHDLQSALKGRTKPLVLRKLVSDWPIVKLKNDEDKAALLLSKSASKPVRAWVAQKQHKGRFFYNEDMTGFNFTQQHVLFNEVLAWLMQHAGMSEQPTVYMGSTSVDEILPSYRKEHDIEHLKNAPLVSLWMGNQSRVAAHFDVTDNVACVLAGERTFSVFPPDQWDNLYIGPIEFNPAGQPISLVDFTEPDFQQFPKFETALANGFEVTLQPGDAIFIPSMWWHHVEALSSFNLLQNYWWRQAPECASSPNDALVHAMLSIKDLPLEQRQAWRAIFDRFIFDNTEQTHIADQHKGFLKVLDEEQAAKMRKLLKYQLDI